MTDATNNDMDALKITNTVKEYFEKVHGNLGLLLFKVESVKPNSKENIWIVQCSFYPSLGSAKRASYRVKVNIKTGKIEEVESVEQNV